MRFKTIGTNQHVIAFKNGNRVLWSYETPCAIFTPDGGYSAINSFVSYTTQRHIDDWTNGEYKPVTIQQIAAFLVSASGDHGAANE